MKWVFLAILCMACPVITMLVRTPRHQPPIGFLFGLLPFMLGPWHLVVAPISGAGWPGHTKGIEVSLIDCLAVAVLFGMRRLPGRAPLIIPFVAYILVITMTAFWSINKMATLYYAFQLCRMLIVYLAAMRLSRNPKAVLAMISGGAAALAIQTVYAFQQHAQGQLQATGILGTQNLLGIMVNLTAIPACALLLTRSRSLSAKVSPILAVVLDVLTASRATLGFAAIGAVALFGFSGAKQWTSRKTALLAMLAATCVVVAPLALQRINQRATGNSVESSNAEREAFKNAAWYMIHDHPFGVGANDYVVVANTQGYSARAGVASIIGSRATNVHNSYLLVLAETGYPGLFCLIALFLPGISSIIYTAVRSRRDVRGDVSLGFGVTLLAIALQLNYEWLFVVAEVQYLIFTFLGIGIGLTMQIKLDPARSSKVRPAQLAMA